MSQNIKPEPSPTKTLSDIINCQPQQSLKTKVSIRARSGIHPCFLSMKIGLAENLCRWRTKLVQDRIYGSFRSKDPANLDRIFGFRSIFLNPGWSDLTDPILVNQSDPTLNLRHSRMITHDDPFFMEISWFGFLVCHLHAEHKIQIWQILIIQCNWVDGRQ